MDGKDHDQERTDHKPGDADEKDREETGGVVSPPAPSRSRIETQWNSQPLREAKREQAKGHGDGQALKNNIIDAVIPVFHRSAEIPVSKVAQVAEILFPNRLIQMVFGFDIALDL